MKHQFYGTSLGDIEDPLDNKKRVQIIYGEGARKVAYALGDLPALPKGARLCITVEAQEQQKEKT